MRNGSFRVSALAAFICLAFLAACRGEPSAASRSARAYEDTRASGVPLESGHDHGGGDAKSSDSPAAAPAGPAEMDHAAMGHGPTPAVGRGDAAAESAHAGHVASRARPDQPAGHANHATATSPPHAGHGGHSTPSAGRPAPASAHAGHGTAAAERPAPAPSAPMDHSAMGHGSPAMSAGAAVVTTKTAMPGGPGATLMRDALDSPASTSLLEAERAREAAASAHAMGHGVYRQVDAGRDDVPVTSPVGPQRRGSAPDAPAASPSGHEGHGTPAPSADPHAGHAMPAPAPTPDPHAGHSMPAPSPSPRPEGRR